MDVGGGICVEIKETFSIHVPFFPLSAEHPLCVVFLGQFQHVIQCTSGWR